MGGLSETEINIKRKIAIFKLESQYGKDNIDVLDTDFNFPAQNALYYLARSIEVLSSADLAYFVDGWENYRGCKIEHDCCIQYQIPIQYE